MLDVLSATPVNFLLVFPHSFLLATKLTRIIHSRDGHISVLVEKSWQFSQTHAVRRAEGLLITDLLGFLETSKEIAAVLLCRSFEFDAGSQ